MEQQEMHIGIIGAGNIGGNAARQLAHAGHQVTVSFARDQTRLRALAEQLGATAAQPADAAQADVVVLSVPLGVIDQALAQAGPLGGRIVVDTNDGGAAPPWGGVRGGVPRRRRRSGRGSGPGGSADPTHADLCLSLRPPIAASGRSRVAEEAFHADRLRPAVRAGAGQR